MDKDAIFTIVIPVLLIGVLVYYNLHKMRSHAHKMEEQCPGECANCAHKDVCSAKNTEE